MIHRLAARARSLLQARSGGLLVSGAGWGLLAALALTRLAGLRLQTGDLVAALALVICLLLAGATLLVLDALNRGFGALDNFFKEALARSARRNAEQARAPERSPFEDKPPRRGTIGDRPYVVRGDGAVTVETLLGRRTFASLMEAQEFVGA